MIASLMTFYVKRNRYEQRNRNRFTEIWYRPKCDNFYLAARWINIASIKYGNYPFLRPVRPKPNKYIRRKHIAPHRHKITDASENNIALLEIIGSTVAVTEIGRLGQIT